MYGGIGNDVFGTLLKENLTRNGVNTPFVTTFDGPTGIAFISVFPTGDNSILLSPGANGKITPEWVKQVLHLQPGDLLLLQLEIPMDAIKAALDIASTSGTTVILDPAPAQEIPDHWLSKIHYLTPNQTEAQILLGLDAPPSTEQEIHQVIQKFLSRGIKNVILKCGEKGAYWGSAHQFLHVPALEMKAIDTTAAGDTFNAAFATGLAEEKSTEESLQLAVVAAGISVTRRGAQSSMPTRQEVEDIRSRMNLRQQGV